MGFVVGFVVGVGLGVFVALLPDPDPEPEPEPDPLPEGWDQMRSYIRDGGPRPSYEQSRQIFDEMLENQRDYLPKGWFR